MASAVSGADPTKHVRVRLCQSTQESGITDEMEVSHSKRRSHIDTLKSVTLTERHTQLMRVGTFVHSFARIYIINYILF